MAVLVLILYLYLFLDIYSIFANFFSGNGSDKKRKKVCRSSKDCQEEQVIVQHKSREDAKLIEQHTYPVNQRRLVPLQYFYRDYEQSTTALKVRQWGRS